ncbi:MAG: hypothetical protein HQ506_05455 [Candidatus Marinimicrobia bacterium]|nr:hypothetical protein [Candidatus Neomarinimicrobiota bacterium]
MDCALIALATGKRARTLKNLRDYLETIEPQSIYYHFWGSLLRPRFEDAEYHNDFAGWAAHSLHDTMTAERLGIVNPLAFQTMEELRQELMDIIDERIDELEVLPASSKDSQFEFISSDMVVFRSDTVIRTAAELLKVIPTLSLGSIFYHFIDARRRTEVSHDDFSTWLQQYECAEAVQGLAEIDPFFTSLSALRQEITEILTKHLSGDL